MGPDEQYDSEDGPICDLHLSSESELDDGAEEQGHEGTCGHLTIKGQTWSLHAGRLVDPAISHGYNQPARLLLHNYTDKNELSFFQGCFPSHLVPSIANVMTTRGREVCNYGSAFLVTPGEVWQFLGYHMHMLVNPVPGDRTKLWRPRTDVVDGTVYIPQELNRYGMTHGRWRQLNRAFSLPMAPEENPPDPFRPIRLFEREWNNSVKATLSPGKTLVVDESMGLWKGRGMPGLMKVRMAGACLSLLEKITHLSRACRCLANQPL